MGARRTLRSSKKTSSASTGSAYAQRKMAAVDGDAWLSLTRMLENAIVIAPITAQILALEGRSAHCMKAAVDVHDFSGDTAREVGQQEADGAADDTRVLEIPA